MPSIECCLFEILYFVVSSILIFCLFVTSIIIITVQINHIPLLYCAYIIIIIPMSNSAILHC